jgi:glycine cleavage system aminomethyltransferase T
MGYVEVTEARIRAPIEIEIRGKTFPAMIAKKPILKRNQ